MRIETSSPGYVIGFSAAISVVFTFGIMALHAGTAGRVEINERLLEQRALLELFGLADTSKMSKTEIARMYSARIVRSSRRLTDRQTGWSFSPVLALKGEAGREPAGTADLVGMAFPIGGVGFWAHIGGYMAVTPDADTAIGVVFLNQRETPGLGGRITEKQWRDRFKGLDVRPPRAGGSFVYIGGPEPTGVGDPRFGRRVDAISGATQTSAAVEKFINEDLSRFRRALAGEEGFPTGGGLP